MHQIAYRAVATGGVALAIVLGLVVQFSVTLEVTVWFGIISGLTAAGATIVFVLQRQPTAAIISLAASASSVASGQAGIATMGALAGLAIFIALSDVQPLRPNGIRR